jgi:hypothetical protein
MAEEITSIHERLAFLAELVKGKADESEELLANLDPESAECRRKFQDLCENFVTSVDLLMRIVVDMEPEEREALFENAEPELLRLILASRITDEDPEKPPQ